MRQPPTLSPRATLAAAIGVFSIWYGGESAIAWAEQRSSTTTAQPVQLPAHRYDHQYSAAYSGRHDGWKRICADGWNWSGMRGECVDNRRTVASR